MTRGLSVIITCFMVLLMGATPSFAAQLFNPNIAKAEPSRLFPILPDINLGTEKDRTISKEIGKQIYDRCLSQVPPRFTPDAHRYYCTCSSAATLGTMTRGELHDLQSEKNRVLGHPTFEKYVREVVAPCMDMPLNQIEYLNCAVNVNNDQRIVSIAGYCKCVATGMGRHFKSFGALDMLSKWGNGKSKMYDDPIGALWESDDLQRARDEARRFCVGNHLRPDPYKQ